MHVVRVLGTALRWVVCKCGYALGTACGADCLRVRGRAVHGLRSGWVARDGYMGVDGKSLMHRNTSLGLAQVQLRSPKVVVAPKNGKTSLEKIKSSSPTKYEHIHPLSHRLRVQSIKFVRQLDIRMSMYEHLHLLQ